MTTVRLYEPRSHGRRKAAPPLPERLTDSAVPHRSPASPALLGQIQSKLKVAISHFAVFCGLKHAPCMPNLLGIFVSGHYGALYTQNDENGVILKKMRIKKYDPKIRKHVGGFAEIKK